MNTKSFLTLSLALSVATLSSCNNLADFNTVPHNSVGSTSISIKGTVVDQRSVRIEASGRAKNITTGIGALAGGAAGSMIGGGSGKVLSTVGFAILGGIAGNSLANSTSGQAGQVLTVRGDNGTTYSITQPVYKEFGIIATGTTGTLTMYGSNNNQFRPY